MDVLVDRCAGLDVHRDTVVATVRVPAAARDRGRHEQHTRTFATTAAGITALGDWLGASPLPCPDTPESSPARAAASAHP